MDRKKMTEAVDPLLIDYRYLAGLFDGEGCITVYTRKDTKGCKNLRYVLRIQITNINVPLMDYLNSIGWYVIKRSSSKYTIRVCYEARLEDRKAANFLIEVLPFLRIKYHEAALAIEFQIHKHSFGVHRNWKLGLPEEELMYRKYIKRRLSEIKAENGGYDEQRNN